MQPRALAIPVLCSVLLAACLAFPGYAEVPAGPRDARYLSATDRTSITVNQDPSQTLLVWPFWSGESANEPNFETLVQGVHCTNRYTAGSDYPEATGCTYWISSGSLPLGLSLDAATGVVQGVPTQAGTWTYTVSVTDSLGRSGSGTFTSAVGTNPQPEIATATAPSLVYGRYIGDSDDDTVVALATDSDNNVIVSVASYPTGPGWFVSKLDPAGEELWRTPVASPYWAQRLAADCCGNLYAVCGRSFVTSSPVRVVKLGSDGSVLWRKEFGGSGKQCFTDFATDAYGGFVVVGRTSSVDFPVSNGCQGTYAGGTSDGYIVKFSPNGDVEWATFLGGGGFDYCNKVLCDARGDIYVAGVACSIDFPDVAAGARAAQGSGSAFVAKIKSSGRLIRVSRFGSGTPNDIVLNEAGEVFVAGWTDDADFPWTGALFSSNADPDNIDELDGDGFVVKLDANGAVGWSGCIGGTADDRADGLAFDNEGNLLVTGLTVSRDFPKVATTRELGDPVWEDVAISPCFAKVSTGGQVLSSGYIGTACDYTYSTQGDEYTTVTDSVGNALCASMTLATAEPPLHGYGLFPSHEQGRDTITPSPTMALGQYSSSGRREFTSYLTGRWGSIGTMAVDESDCIVAGGSTTDQNYLLAMGGPDDTLDGYKDGYVVKLKTYTDLPAGRIGVTYGLTLTGRYGTPPYSWALASGRLPGGLALNAATGRISGTPTEYGTFRFSIEMSDSNAAEGSDVRPFALAVSPERLTIMTSGLPDTYAGAFYRQALTAGGGSGSSAWSVSSGALPPGLSLDAASGVISGTVTTTGAWAFTVRVQDGAPSPASAAKLMSITVRDRDDSDNDGLSDDWELDCFGTLDYGPADDCDGDGLSNAVELAYGSDPAEADTEGPVTRSVVALPNVIRKAIDTTVSMSAIADETTTGHTAIAAVLVYLDDLSSAPVGAMQAADGAYDEVSETAACAVGVATWSIGPHTLYVRARDLAGNVGAAAGVSVTVADNVPPTAVTDLAVAPVASIDKLAGAAWQTPGTLLGEDETLTLDLGEERTIGAVSLESAASVEFFPRDFSAVSSVDGVEWAPLLVAADYKAPAGVSLWLVGEVRARYVKLEAKPVQSRTDGRWYVRVAEAACYAVSGTGTVRATWTAPADSDGGPAGPAQTYDLRYGPGRISEGTFASSTTVAEPPEPGVPGAKEEAVFATGRAAGTVFAAMKSADGALNWSAMSNVAGCQIRSFGVAPSYPDDEAALPVGQVPQFTFATGSGLAGLRIVFSDTPGFGGSGTASFPLASNATWFGPSAAQWKSIGKLFISSGTVYWRLCAGNAQFARIFSRARSMFMDVGRITDLQVEPAHAKEGDDALWPDQARPPEFRWASSCNAIVRFCVDISAVDTTPAKDPRTVTCAVSEGTDLQTTRAQWKKVRTLAAKAGGVLYWRVRGYDKSGFAEVSSAAKKLVVDGGTWSLSDLDLGASSPAVSWAHDGQGLARCWLQVSTSGDFPSDSRRTLRLSAAPVAAGVYVLRSADTANMHRLAARNGVATLYYRICAEDSERAFRAYSQSRTVDAPQAVSNR